MILQILSSSFAQNLSATLIGVFVGFMLANYANVSIARRERKRRERTFLKGLQAALKDQIPMIERIREDPGGAWAVPLNLTILESTASVKYEIIDDIELNRELDFLLFVMAHLSNFIQIYQQALIMPTPQGKQAPLRPSQMLDVIEEACRDAKKVIEKALISIRKTLEPEIFQRSQARDN